jgi:RNA polymerase sigma factor (sigma-70 family)
MRQLAKVIGPSETSSQPADMSDENRRFQSLLRQLQEGSHEAARELAETYAEHVLRCVRARLPRKLRSQYDSIDFVQLVWKSVFTEPDKLAKLRDADQFVRFLAGIARNKVALADRQLQTLKKDVDREVRLDAQCPDAGPHPVSRDPSPSATAVFHEHWDDLVQQQTLRDGQVVEMRYEGSTFDEIAENLDIDEATARKIIRRIKRRKTPITKRGNSPRSPDEPRSP